MYDHSLELIQRIGQEKLIGVEVGVYRGENARLLLEHCPNLTLYLVDIWETKHYTTPQDLLYLSDISDARKLVYTLRQEFIDRCRVINQWSTIAAKQIPSVDFVFIDAEHSYENTIQDIQAWLPVPTRWIGGHDFCTEFDGVQRAVRESFNIFELGKGTTWFYDKRRSY